MNTIRWPEETSLTVPFWEGVRQKELRLQYDGESGVWQFFPKPAAITGAGHALTWRAASGGGRLIAATRQHVGASQLASLFPYVVGFVQLDEGPRMFAFIDATFEALKSGQRLHVVFASDSETQKPVFYFRLDDEGSK